MGIRTKTALALASLIAPVFLLIAPPHAVAQNPEAGSKAVKNFRTITLADNGKTLVLNKGGRFLLDLGTGFDWNVQIADESIVSRVSNILVIKGAQGIYKAHKIGSTILTATGDPLCRKATPQCAAPSRLFTLNIRVRTPIT